MSLEVFSDQELNRNDFRCLSLPNPLFFSEGNGPKIQVLVQDETIWLSQKQMAELFEVSTDTINEHLKNIFKDEELRETSVIRNFQITANDGKNYNTKRYRAISINFGNQSTRAKGTLSSRSSFLRFNPDKRMVNEGSNLRA